MDPEMKHGVKLAIWAFAGLLVLTGTTFGLSYAHLGRGQIPVALAIALLKSALVALFFMNLVEQHASNWIAFVVGWVIASMLILLAMFDVISRIVVSATSGSPV